MVAYTERVIRVCAALLFHAYDEYVLWYVPPDIINFALNIVMDMEVSLRSIANVREWMELLDVIASTQLSLLPNS